MMTARSREHAARRGQRAASASSTSASRCPGMPHSPNHPGFRMTLHPPARRHGARRRRLGRQRADRHRRPRRHPRRRALARLATTACCTAASTRPQAQMRRPVPRARRRHHRADRAPRRPARRRRPSLGVDVPRAGLRGHAPTTSRRPRGRRASSRGAGDVALVRTGWARHFDDADALPRPRRPACPGVTEDGARWLAERGVRAAGADTIAFEQIPPGAGHALLPVHRMLLVEHGIHIIETLDLERARRGRASRVPVRAGAAADRRRHRLAGPPARGASLTRLTADDRRPAARRASPRDVRARRRCRDAVARRRRARGCSTCSASALAARRLPSRRAAVAAVVAELGRHGRGRRRSAPAGALPGRRRRAGQRHARALARLRRHPPAVGAAPDRVASCRPRWPRPRPAGAPGADAARRRRRRASR